MAGKSWMPVCSMRGGQLQSDRRRSAWWWTIPRRPCSWNGRGLARRSVDSRRDARDNPTPPQRIGNPRLLWWDRPRARHRWEGNPFAVRRQPRCALVPGDRARRYRPRRRIRLYL